MQILSALSRAGLHPHGGCRISALLSSRALSLFISAIRSRFALCNRDNIVAAAQSSAIFTQLNVGHPFRAGFLDFEGNLVAGTSSGLLGLSLSWVMVRLCCVAGLAASFP